MNPMATLPANEEQTVRTPWGWRIPVTFTSLFTAQGIYYLITGLWPLLSLDTFERVTGPKTDYWLVKTVGLLVLVEGIVFLVAAWRRTAAVELAMLALGSAAVLALVDVVYSAGRVISLVYLLDAFLQGALIAGWCRVLFHHKKRHAPAETPPPPKA
jgi:hypothetical protein